LQTNVISLEPKFSISHFRSSAIDVASPRKTDVLLAIRDCRKLTGLLSREVLLGVSPSPRHRATLRGYLRLCHGNAREVQDVLVHDLRSYLEIGARHFAADQLIVLRIFLSEVSRGRPPQDSAH
jgi:hypothetical protein